MYQAIIQGMASRDGQADPSELKRMQGGIRAWVLRIADNGGRGLRSVTPSALLSLLCAAAFAPLVPLFADLSGAAEVAGIEILSSVGAGVLSSVITSSLDRMRSAPEHAQADRARVEAAIAAGLRRELAAEGADASALRTEIAVVLERINAGGTALQAAISTGSDQVRQEVMTAVRVLGTGFAEMRFLIGDVRQAADEIQQTLNVQGADVRVLREQNARQLTELALVREDLAVIERQARALAAGQAPDDRRPLWDRDCPYRGLMPFDEAHAEVFYGREQLTAALLAAVAAQLSLGGIVLVTGASGAGKSSLLRAGLLPRLASGQQITGSQHWPRLIITPSRDPLTELATQLAALSGADVLALRENLAERPDEAHLAVRQAVLADAARRAQERTPEGAELARLVLIVDQFEQIFTLVSGPDGESGRQAFIGALAAAATTPCGPGRMPAAAVVIAVRGDFWDRCAEYTELTAALPDGLLIVGPMTESDLRLTITGPAESAGADIDAALVDTILADAHAAGEQDTGGALPLLSQAMARTWDLREGGRLTSHGYEQAGGVRHAVQDSADEVYDALPPARQLLAREYLLMMTVAGRDGRFARRPVSRQDLLAAQSGTGAAEADEVLEEFAAKRLVVLNDGSVQIAHDALLSAWPRLRGWLEEDQSSLILLGQLADDAADWQGNRSDSSFLYRGAQLAAVSQAVKTWTANPVRYPALTGLQREFLEDSEHAAAASMRRRRIVTGALVLLLVVAVTAAGIAVVAARRAQHDRDLALSRQLAADSEQLDGTDPVTAAALAAAAWRTDNTAQAAESLLEVLAYPERVLLHAPGPLTTVAVSPNGKLLAAGDFNDGSVRVWNIQTHQQVGRAIPGGSYAVTGLAFSPNGTLLAIDAGGQVRLWNVRTRRLFGTTVKAGGPTGVAFSPNGQLLATGDINGTARLWQVATQHQLGSAIRASSVLDGPNGPAGVSDVAFSPDGTMLATADADGTARLWNVRTHALIGATKPYSGSVNVVAFNPSGTLLATGAGKAQLWRVATRQSSGPAMNAAITPTPSSQGVTSLAFSPDGKTLATAGTNESTARLWSVATSRQIGAPLTATVNSAGDVEAVAFTPDGMLATAGDDGSARLWAIRLLRPDGPPLSVGTVNAVTNLLTSGGNGDLTLSPGGLTLALAQVAGGIRLAGLATRGQIIAAIALARADSDVYWLALSPAGHLLVTASGNSHMRLWSTTARQWVGKPVEYGAAQGAVFSPNGKIFATAGDDGTARLWSVARRRQIGKAMDATTAKDIDSEAFSANGRILATGADDGTARLWNVATQQPIGISMTAGTGSGDTSVYAVAFSPNGRFLATASGDGTVRLWDVATQHQVGPDLITNSDASELVFSPDGKTLVAADSAGTVWRWDVAFPSTGRLVGAVCSMVGTAVTTDERDALALSGLSPQQSCPK